MLDVERVADEPVRQLPRRLLDLLRVQDEGLEELLQPGGGQVLAGGELVLECVVAEMGWVVALREVRKGTFVSDSINELGFVDLLDEVGDVAQQVQVRYRAEILGGSLFILDLSVWGFIALNHAYSMANFV